MKRNQLVFFLMIACLSVGLGCANYGAFQGFTSDGLYISPSPIQSRVVEPQFFYQQIQALFGKLTILAM